MYGDQIAKQAECLGTTTLSINLKDRLRAQLQSAQTNINNLQELIGLLENNPELGRALELLGVVGRL